MTMSNPEAIRIPNEVKTKWTLRPGLVQDSKNITFGLLLSANKHLRAATNGNFSVTTGKIQAHLRLKPLIHVTVQQLSNIVYHKYIN